MTGRRAFGGAQTPDVLTAVLRDEPAWDALPSDTPPPIRRLLRRALQKDRRQRLADVADARLEIEDALAASSTEPPVARPARRGGRLVVAALAAAAVLVAILGVALWFATRPAPAAVRRVAIVPPAGAPLNVVGEGVNVAISPDGRTLIYTGGPAARGMLMAQRADDLAPTPVEGTELASGPFFSPDGNHVGFASQGVLKRVPLAGGPVTPITDVRAFRGASWAGDVIVFSDGGDPPGLFRVPAGGGTAERLTSPARGELHKSPDVLPGGRGLLFTLVPSERLERPRIVFQDLSAGDQGQQNVVIDGGVGGRYVASGHLVYARLADGTIMAARFDPAGGRILGTPVELQQDVNVKPSGGPMNLAVGADGTAAYVSWTVTAADRHMIWMTRDGVPTPLVDDSLMFARYPRLSPDGERLAVTLGARNAGEIWIYDLRGRSQPRKVTFASHNVIPLWMPDGQQIIYQSRLEGNDAVYLLPADGSRREPERLVIGSTQSRSADGSIVVFARIGRTTGADLWLLHLADRRAEPFLETPSSESEAEVSPDGRWIAYVSDETGTREVYVRPFPKPGAAVRVSADGGHAPKWSRDSQELFFVADGPRMMAATVLPSTGEFRTAPVHTLFQGNFIGWSPNEGRIYDVAPDGRFLMFQQVGGRVAPPIVLVLNWFDELRRLVAAN